MIRSSLPALASALAVALVGWPATARAAGECEINSDCGKGFECFQVVTSSRDEGGSGGGAMTGAGGTAGSDGSEAGTGSGQGAAPSAGTSGSPLPSNVCGNGLCDGSETPATCPNDCVYFNYCGPAECTASSDCAEGYACDEPIAPGTGGGPNAPFCGDSICTGGETASSCPADCDVKRYCAPESGYCLSDAECADGFYCSFVGMGGTGGFGTGGSAGGDGTGGSTGNTGGSAGASGGTPGTGASAGTGASGTAGTGPAVGGANGMPDSGSGFAPPAGAAGMSAGGAGAGGEAGEPADPIAGNGGSGGIVAEGTCMPRDVSGTGGSAGTTGTGMGGETNGGVGTAGTAPAAGTGTGGTGSDNPPPGSGGTTSDGARSGGGTAPGANGGSPAVGESDEDDDGNKTVVTHAGCTVARSAGSSHFSLLAVLGLGVLFTRRRRAR